MLRTFVRDYSYVCDHEPDEQLRRTAVSSIKLET